MLTCLYSCNEYLRTHRSVCMAGAAILGIAVAGIGSFLIVVVLPLAFITFPLWIVPACLTSLATAPLWVPAMVVLLILLFVLLFVSFSIGLTSQGMRKRGAMLSSKIKQTEVGKRVMYEKTS